jgi:iron transport multicopper oxidase
MERRHGAHARRSRLGRVVVMASLLAGGLSGGLAAFHVAASQADTTTPNADLLRTSWYPDEASLSPQTVAGGTFGQLFSAQVTGQVYAQPLVADNTLLVASETNDVYGLDPRTGAQKWHVNLGAPFVPARYPTVAGCNDLTPNVGVTATPVVDPGTKVMYLTSKTVLADAITPVYYLHALSVVDGSEQPGFPVAIAGAADNAPSHTFNALTQLQRPGLLLLNGVVYAAFGGHCDNKPYEGWVIGVSEAGALTARWTDEPGYPQNDPAGPGGGIWGSDGGLLSDGSGQIVLATGNGETVTSPAPGSSSQPGLAQAVIRLQVQTDGTLQSTDFFAPYDASSLNANDSDLGSGSPTELPSAYFGTPAHPHLIVEMGKQGYMYLLDAQSLGGMGQGSNGSDNAVYSALGRGGCWCHPAVWPGDGGWVYMTTAGGGGTAGLLQAWKYGLDGNGNPTVTLQGTSADQFGFGSSSASVTSSGTTSGSALVWVVWIPTTATSPGAGAQLRAYGPVPGADGKLPLLWSAPIGTATKFTAPQIDNGTVYIGARDGHVLGFGFPVLSPITGSSLQFGTVTVGSNSTATATITANSAVTINSVSAGTGIFQAGTPTPGLPASLTAGQTLSVPVTFTPGAPGVAGGTLQVTTSTSTFSYGLEGQGQAAGPHLTVNPCCLSFGGVPAGGQASNAVTLTDDGAQSLQITGYDLPSAAYTITGLPPVGSTIASGQTITATVTFAPSQVGLYTDDLDVASTGGDASVSLDGSGGTPPQMQISNQSLEYGSVPMGVTATLTFTVHNAGGTALTITKSKPPAGDNGYTAVTTLAEGSTLLPGATATERVNFTPAALGDQTAQWTINANDNAGVRTVNFDGTGTGALPPYVAAQSVDVVRPTTGTTIANVPVVLSAPSPTQVTVNYTTKDGSATQPTDYLPTSGTLTFPPGVTTANVPVTVNGAYAAASTFTVSLTNASGASISQASGKVFLANALLPPSIYVGDTNVAAPTGGGTATLNFPVTISPPPNPGQPVTVQATTGDGITLGTPNPPAKPAVAANGDYVPVSTTLTFTSTAVTQNVAVTVLHAPTVGQNSTIVLNLSGQSSGNIGDSQGVGTVVNVAPPLPSLYVSDAQLLRPSSGTAMANFTFSVSPPLTPGQQVAVTFATTNGGSLQAPADYAAVPGWSTTFVPGGPSSVTASVLVNGSAISSGTGTINFAYVNVKGAFAADKAAKAYVVSPNRHPFVSVEPATAWASPNEATTVQVPVVLQQPAAQPVTITASSKDGTAVAGIDYQGISAGTQVTIPAGQTQASVPVTIDPGSLGGSQKSFTVSISGPGGGVQVVEGAATVTIVPPVGNVTQPPPPTAPVLTADAPAGDATVGAAYGYTFAASGSPSPSFTVASGQLPPGLALDPSGVLGGVPTTAGSYTFTVQAANGVGAPAVSPSLTINVAPPPVAPAFTADSPPTSATVAQAYSYTFTAAGQPAPTFSLNSGSLPPGLTLDSSGDLTGTPTNAGSYTFTVAAANGIDIPAVTPSITITVTTGESAPTITSANNAKAVAGTPFSFTVTTTGSPAPALTSTGPVPGWLTFTDNGDGTATMTGTPSTPLGPTSLTLTAHNGSGPDAVQPFTLTVDAAPVFTSNNGYNATAGTAFSFPVTTTAYPTASLSESGALPSTVTFTDNGSGTGTLTGTPPLGSEATYTVTLTATNGIGTATTQMFNLTVNGIAPQFTADSPPATAYVGIPYAYTFAASGDPTPTYTATSANLPPNVQLTGAGVLSGTPTATGTYTFSVAAMNPYGMTTSPSVTITVLPQPADLSTSLTGTTSVSVGSQFSFTVTVTNHGPMSATGIVATFTLPPNSSFVSAPASGTTVPAGVYGNGVVTWTLPSALANGAHINLKVTLLATASGTVTAAANVTASTPDDNLGNNQSSWTIKLK